MPIKRSRLTKTEQEQYRASLLKLEEIHIKTECMVEPPPRPKRFTLEPIYPEFARVYDLPAGDVAVVLPAKFATLKSGVMFTDAAVFPQWDDVPLGLEGPEENRYFDRLADQGFVSYEPATILNHLLVGRSVPLRICRHEEGLIIATGWSNVPAKYHDETCVTLKQWLKDEQGTEFSCDFSAGVSRRFKREDESSRPDPREIAERLAKRVPLFGHEKAKPGAERAAACDARTNKTDATIKTNDRDCRPDNTSCNDIITIVEPIKSSDHSATRRPS